MTIIEHLVLVIVALESGRFSNIKGLAAQWRLGL